MMGHGAKTIEVLDISKNGMAFAIKDGNFAVGDMVEIILDFDCLDSESSRFIQRGQILSGLLLRQGKSCGVEQSTRRFSIQFQSELETRVLENLRMVRISFRA